MGLLNVPLGRLLGGGSFTPASLTGLLDEWSAESQYCLTNGACDFASASTQYLTNSTDDLSVSTSFEIAMWVNVDDLSAIHSLIHQGSARPGGAGGVYEAYIAKTSGDVNWRVRNAADSVFVAETGVSIAAATDTLIFLRYDATPDEIGVAINDGSFSTTAIVGVNSDTGPFHIGTLSTLSLSWDGFIQSVVFLRGRTFTASERTALYNSGSGILYEDAPSTLTSEATSALSWWGLTESYGARVDSHGSADLTAVNSPGVAAGVASGTCQSRSPWKEWAGFRNGETFDQATIANQPRWLDDADGSGNPGSDFDGTNYTATLTASMSQPFLLAAIVRFDAAGDYVFGGDVVGEFVGRGASDWEAAFGSTLADGTPDGNEHRLIAYINGVSSSIYIDGVEVASGDVGAGGVSQIVLGAKGDGSAVLDGRVRHVVIAEGDNADKIADLDTYLAGI